jgi:DNA-binding XRE family transcriptional regulator
MNYYAELAKRIREPAIRAALMRSLDPKEWPDGPDVLQVSRARERAALTQAEAAGMVWRSRETWAKWEATTVARSRGMDPALWLLWRLRVAILRGWPLEWAEMSDAAFARMVAK